MSCGKMVPIQKGPSVSLERRYDYYPVEHREPPAHAACGGVVNENDRCQKCGDVAEVVVLGAPCNGHKRATT